MAVKDSSAAPRPSRPLRFLTDSPATRRDMLVVARWSLVIPCSYLVLFSDRARGPEWLALLLVAVLLGSNLTIGRMSPAYVDRPRFKFGVALVDTLLITSSLTAAGQFSVELVLLCLGVLVFAIAGLPLGIVYAATFGMTAAYLLVVWLVGHQYLWQSDILLRAPFLLGAAIVYASLAEFRRHGRWGSVPTRQGDPIGDVVAHLEAQRDAIGRCQAALSDGAKHITLAALEEVALQQWEISGKVSLQPLRESTRTQAA